MKDMTNMHESQEAVERARLASTAKVDWVEQEQLLLGSTPEWKKVQTEIVRGTITTLSAIALSLGVGVAWTKRTSAMDLDAYAQRNLTTQEFKVFSESGVKDASPVLGAVENFGLDKVDQILVLPHSTSDNENKLEPYYIDAFNRKYSTGVKDINTFIVRGSGVRESSLEPDSLLHSDSDSVQIRGYRTFALVEDNAGMLHLLGGNSKGYFTGSQPDRDTEVMISDFVMQGGSWGIPTESGFVTLVKDQGGRPNLTEKFEVSFVSSDGTDPGVAVISTATPVAGINGAELTPRAVSNISPEASEILANLGPTFTPEQLDNPELLPFVDFETLNSPAFAEAMYYAANNGLLPKHPDTAVVMDHVTLTDPEKYDLGGIDQFFIPDLPGKQAKEENRSYVPVYSVRTNINGIDANMTYESYKNKDGSYGVLGYFNPPYSLSKDQGKTLKRLLTFDQYGIVLTGLYFKDEASCNRYFTETYKLDSTGVKGLCNWVIETENSQNFVKIFQDWSNPKIGVLNNHVQGNEYYLPIVVGGFEKLVK